MHVCMCIHIYVYSHLTFKVMFMLLISLKVTSKLSLRAISLQLIYLGTLRVSILRKSHSGSRVINHMLLYYFHMNNISIISNLRFESGLE